MASTTIFQGWMGSGYNLDPAKIGQEGYNLLKYYEQQLKALQVRNMQYNKGGWI